MVAIEVAEMETTIQFLRDQVRDLELTNRALEAENAIYQSRLQVAEAAALDELVRSTQMRQTLTDMSAMLISGLRKMEENVDRERRTRAEKEARRIEQERALEVGSGDVPLFMEKNETPPETAPPPPDEIETSSLDRIPANAFAPVDLESDLQKLERLGKGDDKDPAFR